MESNTLICHLRDPAIAIATAVAAMKMVMAAACMPPWRLSYASAVVQLCSHITAGPSGSYIAPWASYLV